MVLEVFSNLNEDMDNPFCSVSDSTKANPSKVLTEQSTPRNYSEILYKMSVHHQNYNLML